MGRYYQIINGKRYEASLINNGRFRVRKAGDGRISLQDAQDLWKIAQDGGRVTEVEEDTLRWLMINLNWTSPAQEWMNEAMAREQVDIRSYYQVIDGLRYDRKILMEGRGTDERRRGMAAYHKMMPSFCCLYSETSVMYLSWRNAPYSTYWRIISERMLPEVGSWRV